MNRYFKQVFCRLVYDLEKYKSQKLPYKNILEGYFAICFRYWMWVRKTVAVHRFFTQREEIHFFKTIKPLYSGTTRYFVLLYHGHIFEPSCIHARKLFWERESQRLEKFIDKNQLFYAYYKNGCMHNDHLYFLRRETGQLPSDDQKFTDYRKMASTSHDHLVAIILSLEWYMKYVQEQLDKPAYS